MKCAASILVGLVLFVGAGAATQPEGEVMTAETFDAARIRMKIENFQMEPAKVEGQCKGSFVVVNTGPGYADDAKHVLPYWMLTIADGTGKQIHLGGGGWSGPMKTGGRIALTFDTHSNSAAAGPGKQFVFPEPGKYVVTLTLYPGRDLKTAVDVKTVTVEVAPLAPKPSTTRATAPGPARGTAPDTTPATAPGTRGRG